LATATCELIKEVAVMVSGEMLTRFQLFEGLDESELMEIARLCHERRYEEGSIILTAGGSAQDIYLLEHGEVDIQVEVVIYDLEARASVYTAREGEAFAWSALVPPHTLTASARCRRQCDVITISGKELIDLLARNEHIGYVVMQNLSKLISSRLAATMIALRHQIQKMSAGRRI
jgi:CRP/FNR family cyclic AMP-dependent transcriptional regulator